MPTERYTHAHTHAHVQRQPQYIRSRSSYIGLRIAVLLYTQYVPSTVVGTCGFDKPDAITSTLHRNGVAVLGSVPVVCVWSIKPP